MSDNPRRATYEAFGTYVRNQRELAQLSLRQAAALARISNPYLSQIEHGLTLPSVTVLSALANALQVSADALLMRAAGAATGDTDQAPAATEEAIRHDPRLDDEQKRALLAVLGSYVGTAKSTSHTASINRASSANGSGTKTSSTNGKTSSTNGKTSTNGMTSVDNGDAAEPSTPAPRRRRTPATPAPAKGRRDHA